MSTKIRIAVQTLPLSAGNYGGCMQALALKDAFQLMGAEVVVVAQDTPIATLKFPVWALKEIAKRGFDSLITPRILRSSLREFQSFVHQTIAPIPLRNRLGLVNSKPLRSMQALVVGSDQVWRAKYASIADYFFKYSSRWKNAPRLYSYAASFGVSTLDEYSGFDMRVARENIVRFSGVAVREVSGAALCKTEFGIDAQLVLDPTLLFEKSHYEQYFNFEKSVNSERVLLAYILDLSPGLEDLLKLIAAQLDVRLVLWNPPKIQSRKLYFENPETYRLLPPNAWLKAFSDATFVVTDSYHGSIFSIIFRKPFVTLGNEARGDERFHSLLDALGLRLKLLSNPTSAEMLQEISTEIPWDIVGLRLSKLREDSKDFLKKIVDLA